MLAKTGLLVILVAALVLVQCTRDFSVDTPGQETSELSPLQKKVVTASDAFGVKLFKQVNLYQEPDENIFISPFSVSMALGMTLNGAAGETAAAMRKTLEFDGLSQDAINTSYKNLTELLTGLDDKVLFEIANSIWYQNTFSVEQQFIDVNKEYFGAQVQGLNFDAPESVDIINGWVYDRTHGRIDKIIERIERETVMFLLNAIYFKGTWQYEFDKAKTVADSFYTAKGSAVPCELMYQENEFLYYENNDFQAIDLPYGDGQFSMSVLLPKPGVSLDSLVQQLSPELWSQWFASFKKQEGLLYMPKFKMDYEITLNNVLKDMGMGVAFSPLAADFTGINKSGGLFITKVHHKTFVEVNEEGTEASAVTVVVIGRTSVGGDSRPFYMRVDRPFLFIIHEHQTGTILFIGKVVNPDGK